MSDWIADYLDYTSSQESPTVFHRWAAIVAIAGALSRKVVLPRTSQHGVEFFRTWPGQICVILVAGAGRCKKSTAINLIADIMKLCGGINVYEGKITPEQLLHKFAGLPSPRLTIVAEELSAFLTKTSYNDGLVDILNKLIDGSNNPYETRQKQIKLQSPALTMLCATTPTNLAKAILPQAVGHGYASRNIYVYSEAPGSPEPLAYSEAPNAAFAKQFSDLKTSLVIRLTNYSNLTGQFRWTRATANWYQEWYSDFKQSPISENEGWPQRLPDHLIRVAMVLAISRGERDYTFAIEDLSAAKILLDDSFANMDKVFAHVGEHQNSERQEKLLSIFRKKVVEAKLGMPIVGLDEIFQRALRWYPNNNEIRSDLQSLVDAGIIAICSRAGEKTKYVLLGA